ncbi:patatin-like phospholipase family protein [Gordonia sp. (in: high G+C Gram-positive bacteria)]|uniref:patatin-like phospholipase family protein n=1 Tax=Gordonia sp. (in: high G+C Gram-positive bacteria) TaxID=84139 RepID=UPI0025C4F412|nr:patatin-like phospholipase family protein [Gordonia sp. (in: high G+C Gram-positive bacteria)]HMS77111.1 patatin-like phospholipase family protein [Gordonia sp. (in: high G+C Gram-positive bacteria)]
MVRASGNEVAQRHPGAVAKRPGSAVVKQPGDDVSPRPGAQVSDGTGDVPKTYKPARVALALGSGGARGYAHIGVIAELADRGYEIVTVSGSSMGALVGGLHCAGKLDEFVDWASTLTQLDLVRLMDVSLSKSGVIGAERVVARVREILGEVTIEELATPFTAVATDLTAGRSVWYQRGSLVDAIRASIAIPGVISPHTYQGRILGDGGILDPLPVAPTVAVPSDVTVGVILGNDFTPEEGASRGSLVGGVVRRNVAPLLDNEFVKAFRDRFGVEILDYFDQPDSREVVPADAESDPAAPSRMGKVEVLTRSLDIMQEALARYQSASHPPDVLIRIPRKAARTLEFHKAVELIEIGRALTATALDQLPERV